MQSYQDILVMNDFVIEAIEEGAQDNFFLMPYFEMLQFNETLTQQTEVQKKINKLYETLSASVNTSEARGKQKKGKQ